VEQIIMKLKDIIKEDVVDKVEFAEEIAQMAIMALRTGAPRVSQEVNALFQRYLGIKPSDVEDQHDIEKTLKWLSVLPAEELSGMLYKMKGIVDTQMQNQYEKLRKTFH